MKRLITLVTLLILVAAASFAENSDNEVYFEPQHIENFAGTRNIRFALSAVAPLNFPNFTSLFEKDKHQLSLGGLGSLGYHHFIFKDVAIGFDIGFGFNVTIGSHIFSYVPILFSATYQPTWKKLEFPLSLNVGFASETYNKMNYFPALVIKPEAGIHYRFNPEVSAGIEASYMFLPQFCDWYGKGDNFVGRFFTLSVVARYYL